MKKYKFTNILFIVLTLLFLLMGIASGDGTDALVVDQNGNVGIGTDSPEALLEIADDAHAGIFINTSSGSDKDSTLRLMSNQQGWDIKQYAQDSTYRFTISDITNTKVPFRIEPGCASNTLYLHSNGKVGIGTTSPTSQLSFGTFNAGITSDTSDGSDSKFISIGGGGIASHSRGAYASFFGNEHSNYPGRLRLVSGNVAGNYIDFMTTGTERMRIDSSGNVGIGATHQFGGGSGVLSLGNAATNPSTTLSNAALFYVSNGEMYAYDSGGNATIISPHPSAEIEALSEPDDPYPFFEKATNRVIGKELVIDKGKAFRLLQTLFPDEKFIWYRDVEKADAVKHQREEWKQAWIAENTIELEVAKDEALEAVEVEIDDESNVVGEEISYRLDGRDVVEVRTPVYAKKVITEWRFKEGAIFDTETGRFYMEKEPTEAEAEAAAEQEFQFEVSDWIRKRM